MILSDFTALITQKLNNIISNQNNQNAKIETINTNIESVDNNIGSVNTNINTINTSINTINTNTEDNKTSFENINNQINNILAELEGLKNNNSSSGGYSSGMQTFTSNGTFVVPENVGVIYVTACGGGAGGYGTCGGQGGEMLIKRPCAVTPGQSISITIGAGGASNKNGGDTKIGNLLTARGGIANVSDATYITETRTKTHLGKMPSAGAGRGEDSEYALGGRGGGSYGTKNYPGGGGGGAAFGNGGDGGTSQKTSGPGTDGTLGGGGGGAGAYEYNAGTPGKGGKGIAYICW